MVKGRLKLNEAQTDELVRLYRVERLSLSQVARRLGISVTAVSCYLRRRGAKLRPQGRSWLHRPDAPSTRQVRRMVRLYQSGLTARQVGDRVGFSRRVVLYSVDLAGVPRHQRGP
jgi:DNA-binding transcriptional regulator LsrR (DeoR family)